MQLSRGRERREAKAAMAKQGECSHSVDGNSKNKSLKVRKLLGERIA